MRTLIVEDDDATRALLVATARDRHHDAQAFADAESVWAFLSAETGPGAFDLAVVDIGLPGQDGIAFCRQFRRHVAGRHAIILLVTADERAETLEAALDAGAHDYVIKPIERRRFAVRLAIAEQRSLANATSRYSREALRESEHRFEAFMTNSPTLAFIKDAHGRFLYVNRRYLEIFGITESDVIGRTVHEIFDESIAIPLLANDVEVLAQGPREMIESVPLADGLHHWLTYKFPLTDTAGRATLVAGIAIDITDRLRAEEGLRAQTARAEALLQVASEVNSQRDVPAILQGICDHTREALGVNLAAVLLHVPTGHRMELAAIAGGTPSLRDFLARVPYPPGTRPSTDEIGVVVINDVERSDVAQIRAMAGLGLRSVAFVRLLRDGEYLGAMGVAALEQPRTFSDDDVSLLQGVADQAAMAIRNARLLDERRRSEEQMRNAQKLESLGVLAGGIAHDFNNLLVGVLGNAGLALLELPDDSPARQPIRDIEVSAQRAAELTRQMLAYSGRGRFRVEPVDLSSVVEEMSQLLRRVISKQTQLSLRLSRQVPAVVADVTQLRQVVMNLITNASDALGDTAGTVTLETGTVMADREMLASTYLNEQLPDGPYVYLEVSDTGCGMDDATSARIFEPFFTTKFTGRGLGLAAVLGIVRGHKGAISVQSAVGTGTTFRVLLPASTSTAGATEAATGAVLSRGIGLVLLVDDEDAVRGLARRVLERGGYQVVEAATGEDALRALAEQGTSVRAVVLDLTMPGLSGEATLQRIRQAHPRLPVIVSSGYVPDEEGTLAGVPFLAKPYRPSELVDAVKEAIEASS